MESATPEKAREVISEYFKPIPKNAVTEIASDSYLIRDPNSGLIRVQVLDRFLFGMIPSADNKARDQYLVQLKANLEK
jgi:hypothetical protein